MNFFDYIKSEIFFKPLTLKYHRVYYDCIVKLIDKSKELPVLYENDARDSITMYLKELNIIVNPKDTKNGDAVQNEYDRNAQNVVDDVRDNTQDNMCGGHQDDEAMSDTDAFADNLYNNGAVLQSSSILSMFYECGWLLPREIGRNGEYVVNISTDCRRFIDFLVKLTEKSGEGAMSNRIFSMYEIMKSAFDENSGRMDRPYSNILIPLIDNELELKNELLDLKESISGIMKMVIVFQDVNDFGQYILKDAMLDKFFNEYFFVKNNGLIPTQLSFIRNKLRMLRCDEKIDKMTGECAEKLLITIDEAQDKVERDFAELQYFLDVEYEENMELIDKRINSYYNLANTRIMLMASSGVRLESLMNDFLNTVASLPQEEQDRAMEKTADCARICSQKYIGYRSFAKIKRVKNEGENIGLDDKELSADEKAAKTEKLIKGSTNHYSVKRVDDFLKLRMGSGKSMSIKEQTIGSKEEALMYAAAMLYARNDEFPYDITLSDDTVYSDIADISDAEILAKGAGSNDK